MRITKRTVSGQAQHRSQRRSYIRQIRQAGSKNMFYGALLFLVMAIVVALVGFGATGGTVTAIAYVFFFVFLAVSLAATVAGVAKRKRYA